MVAIMLAWMLGTAPRTVHLSRGADVGQSTRYWAVEDTTLDSQQPDQTLGGLPTLQGGPGKTVLIRFGDLDRALGTHVRVVDARLVLTLVGGRATGVRGVYAVRVPWGEGPAKTLSVFDPAAASKRKADAWSSTWRMRRAGASGSSWQQAGASGPGDAELIGAAQSQFIGPDQISIGGLGPAVEHMRARWYENEGFSLSLDTAGEFASSQALEGRPVLEVTVEDVAPQKGPDLAVTLIERLPEYERYARDGTESVKEQDGQQVSVLAKPGGADTKKGPASGEAVTYIAHIKNVGDAPSTGHGVRWSIHEARGALVSSPDSVAPGGEVTVQTTVPFRPDAADHRTQPVRVLVEPGGPDADPSNNALEIQQQALNLGIWVERGFLVRFAALASVSFDEWLQRQVRTWNDVVMPQSRFSFAPDGALERVRIQRVTVVGDGTLAGTPATPGGKPNLMFDGEWGFRASDADKLDLAGLDRTLIYDLSTQLGLTSLAAMRASPASVLKMDGGKRITRGSEDRFPGLMGGGDTRNDALLPGDFTLPYEPVFDPVTGLTAMEPTDLYSATDVGALNANLGKRRGYLGEYLYAVPTTILLRASDASGTPLSGATIEVYASAGGVVPDAAPVFRLTTSTSGSALLPTRPTLEASPVTTATGFTLAANPFGRIDSGGANGLLLLKTTVHGVDAWSYVKLWQLIDAKRRSGKDVVFFDVRFFVPAAPFDATNIAKNRIVADSAQRAPTALAALVDDDAKTEVVLGSNVGDWIEIDLGRDRPIGEIRLVSSGPAMWRSFDVMAYETGQRPSEAMLWARELDWGWSARNRREGDADGAFSVPYQGRLARFRFIRIVNTSGGAGSLAEVRASPVRLEGPLGERW